MIINLENDQQKLELSAQVLERLQEGLQAVARLNELPEESEVDVTIVDDEEIHALNREYRGLDTKLAHNLSAGTAGRNGAGGICNYAQLYHLTLTGAGSVENSVTLTADTKSVGSVFHITATVDFSVGTAYSRTYSKVGIRNVSILTGSNRCIVQFAPSRG